MVKPPHLQWVKAHQHTLLPHPETEKNTKRTTGMISAQQDVLMDKPMPRAQWNNKPN
jgi:uncharacterized protein (UPF0276 family)